MSRSVRDVLLQAQQRGTLGDRPIDDVIAHARQFLDALPADAHRIIDVGTGAGVPGLVIAEARPDLELTLVDRRQTRMDALTAAVTSLGWSDRVTVLAVDVADLARNDAHRGRYDVAVSRGFGPPEVTARAARPFLKNGGSLIVSEPPEFDPSRWPESLCQQAGFEPPTYPLGVASLLAIPY